MRRSLAAAAVVAAVAVPAGAWSRIESDHEVTPASVRAKLDGPIAVFTAKVSIAVTAGEYASTSAGLALPAKGMVTAGVVTAGGVARPLALTPADLASARFSELGADAAGAGEATSAVMIAGSPGNATIGIASPRSGLVQLELTVAAPTCFYRDARYVEVPLAWAKAIEVARRTPVPAEVASACDDGRDDGGPGETAWVGFPAPDLVKRPAGDRFGTFAGRVALGEEHVAHVELDVSSVLGDIPRDLATVILVDGSRSMSPEQLEAQRQLVASYLAAAPASRVQVIAYARTPRPLLPGWMSAAVAAGRVDRELRGIAQRNGSAFDAALAEAGAWLARVPGTKRVVLVTDERMAERLASVPPATFKRVLPDGVLVHVVAVDATPQQPVRDEAAKLAPLAAATDGMAVRTGPLAKDVPLDATLLVRPVSIDKLAVVAPGWVETLRDTSSPCADAERIPEGGSCSWWGEGDASSGPVVVSGLVWGKRVQRVVTPALAHARDVARELTALGKLDEPLDGRAAELAYAVDSKWSLYVQWGGTGKYTQGWSLGVAGGGTGGIGDAIDTVHGVKIPRDYADPNLAAQLRPLLAKCGSRGDRVEITLEFTLAEIVDVTASITSPDAAPVSVARRRQACVEDALWDSAPMLTHLEEHDSYSVSLTL